MSEVVLIRHGQADHNIVLDKFERRTEGWYKGLEIPDPSLTELGIKQVKSAKLDKDFITPELIIFSPLARTIETTYYIFEDLWKKFGNDNQEIVKFLPHEGCQEIYAGVKPCDTGRPPKDLEKNYPDFVKFTKFLEEKWYLPKISAEERYKGFLKYLCSLKEKKVVVVAHHMTIRHLVGEDFKNAEARRYLVKDGKLVPRSGKEKK